MTAKRKTFAWYFHIDRPNDPGFPGSDQVVSIGEDFESAVTRWYEMNTKDAYEAKPEDFVQYDGPGRYYIHETGDRIHPTKAKRQITVEAIDTSGFSTENLSGGCYPLVAYLPKHHVLITDEDCNSPDTDRGPVVISVFDGGKREVEEEGGVAIETEVASWEFWPENLGYDVRKRDRAVNARLKKIYARYGKPV